jgi:hypothetical protein
MVQSLRLLLGECIDYSGLSRLGELSVTEAVERYLRYQVGSERWMLSRFVCQGKTLGKLAGVLGKKTIVSPFPVAVVGLPTSSASEWEAELSACVVAMNDFDGTTEDLVEVASFEICPPASHSPFEILRDLKGFSEVEVFIEAGVRDQSEELLVAIAESEWAFLKLDLSGDVKPESFQLAKLIHEALANELPFKVVQGKGSPITNGKEYGLINLFGSVAIGLSEDLSKREIEAILKDEELTNWQFGPDSLSYRGWEANAETLEQAREFLLDAECFSVEYAIDELATIGFAVKEGA